MILRVSTFYAVLLLTSTTLLQAQSWTQLTSNTTQRLWSVRFIDDNTGFVCGQNGTLLKSTDAGITWDPQSLGTSDGFIDIQFVNSTIGYLGGASNGTLFKTTNGGTSWSDISLNVGRRSNGGIWFTSPDTGFIAIGESTYSDSKILKTVDAGASWDTVYSGGTGWVSYFHFPVSLTGYATISGGKILKTTDNGDYWFSVNTSTNWWMSGVYFFDADNGFVGGGMTSPLSGDLFITTNGGGSWQSVLQGYPISKIFFGNSTTGYALGVLDNSGSGSLFKTTDAGLHWNLDATPVSKLTGMCFLSSGVAYAVGDSGIILKYSIPAGVEREHSLVPKYVTLEQNYPNPFNPVTEIRYQISEVSHVTLKVFEVLGREVATLVNGVEQPGYKSVIFDAHKLSSGLYIYRLQTDKFTAAKKLLLLK